MGLRDNYKVIFSNSDAWNFEGPANSWVCSKATTYANVPRPSWKEVYEHSPLDILTGLGVTKARNAGIMTEAEKLPRDLVLGGTRLTQPVSKPQLGLEPLPWLSDYG